MQNVARRIAVTLLIGAVCAVSVVGAYAQEFPSKPLRIVVPSAPGLTTDLTARIMAQEMAKLLGQPITVENRAGAGQLVGLEYVAKQAPADGYTMVITSALGPLVVTERNLPFDPLKDLPPFIGLIEGRSVLISPPTAPWKSFSEMIAYAKANPGKLNYAEASPSTLFRMEALIRAYGVDIVKVSYRSGANMIQGITANESQMGIVSLANALALGDNTRILAVTGAARLPNFPDAPAFAELGYPEIRGSTFDLNVRAGTPRAAVDKLFSAATRALQAPEVKSQLEKLQFEITNDPPDVVQKNLAAEAKMYADIAQRIGFRPQ